MTASEQHIEQALIEKLGDLKYTFRPDIRDRAALEANFRKHFETLNRVKLTDSEFQRLLESIITPDVFTAARSLRERNSFTRDDGTPLNYTLVNTRDWCKNSFEAINQLRIKELADLAHRHVIETPALQAFVDGILLRMIFDGERLSDLMAPLGLGWKARTKAELALMEELAPLLHKRAHDREISGLSAYEENH